MPRSILFACNMNSVRSPMAAALLRDMAGSRASIDSAGVYEGGIDPFIERVLDEIGVSLLGHEPKTMRGLDLGGFDLVIALTPEAAAEARRYLPRERIEFWDVENPSDAPGGREEIVEAYRRVRDKLKARLVQRFAEYAEKP